LARIWHVNVVFIKIKQNKTIEEEAMGRMRENPRYNVISMRISDEERDTLEQIMSTTHKSVSDIMREAMDLLKTQVTSGPLNQQAA
jgi:hypothetical protein